MAALRRPLLILPLLAALAALAPAGAAAASPNVDALLLGATKSPVLSELRDVSDFDATRAADAEAGAPRRYDVLIVDGDRLGTGELGDVGMIERLLDADGFVMVLDASARDHAAIARYISFDLSAGAGGERSEMLMFGNSDAAGQDEMLIVNSGDLRPAGAADAPPAEVRDLKELAARRAAIAARDQIVADRTDTPVGAAARIARANPQLPEATTSCTGDKQLCDLSAQSTSFHVDNTPQFSAPLADGYWTRERGASRDFPKPGVQEASWQSDEYFDVYLDNDGRPQGDNQVSSTALLDLQPGSHRHVLSDVRQIQGRAVALLLRARLVDRHDRRQRRAGQGCGFAGGERLRADDADVRDVVHDGLGDERRDHRVDAGWRRRLQRQLDRLAERADRDPVVELAGPGRSRCEEAGLAVQRADAVRRATGSRPRSVLRPDRGHRH